MTRMTTLPHPPSAPTSAFAARIGREGNAFEAPPDLPLLLAAEQAGPGAGTLQSSCRNGTCRVCICQLIEGRVTYRMAWPGLSADEKAEGFILPCVAYPSSNVVFQPER
jgi:ferredoxin